MANHEVTLSAHDANSNYIQQLEERVDDLESRNVFQDDVIEQLSQELTAHNSQLSELKQQLQLVAKRLKDSSMLSGDTEEIEPPPPHY
ncbi:SlyX family protein [Colwellia sp. E2M01]|uniref:SlyX family protein n=1 Tax=Colwellia sp. E2M01 TaxID=2841561 RepID=UPI001C08A8C7|nr:SlyX family protein [Colwellia sp. E2M01]MBU2869146.1 SlyX family protein [Colwellia sp. E2M01]